MTETKSPITASKSNGVLSTKNRSGQVNPSNSIPNERLTSLRAPSAPMSQVPTRTSFLSICAYLDPNTGLILLNVQDSNAELDLETFIVSQLVQQNARQFELFTLHPIRMSCLVCDLSKIELGDHTIL